ncbi:MAG: sigma 54-interacting transcriptional regulator [Alphaproteobacteria bacterium]|nr:sigma 54-interacting transcriptional regulator [Alphaproteobacteria bacterium]
MPRLTLQRGETPLLELPLGSGPVRLGRSDACDVVLPGEAISREHCVLTRRGERWWAEDRSRHGTWLDGRRLTQPVPLLDGAQLRIGGFTLRYADHGEPTFMTTVARRPTTPASGQVVSAWSGAEVHEPVLVIDEGPDAGRRVPLRHRRLTVGAEGSRLVLSDRRLVRDHFILTLIRGRPMLGPGNGAVHLDGERLYEPTPLYAGERFSAGGTHLHVEPGEAPALPEASSFGAMVGVSAASRRLFGQLACYAQHDAPVLLLGATGTGKELAARGLHSEGPRADGPFVALNCAALPEALIESELFGHEKGAFTGADRRRDGAFQQADGGTLFLDEIGDLPAAAQAKVLRVLESGEVRRVGGHELGFPDVRVVAATHKPLGKLAVEGRFRTDLYFRLSVLEVRLPSLRDRPEDIEVIAQALAQRIGTGIHLGDDALALLRSYPWPGNARELTNVLLRAHIHHGPHITARCIHFNQASFPENESAEAPYDAQLEQSERTLIEAALRRHDGNRSATARELGIPRSTLLYRIKRYGL